MSVAKNLKLQRDLELYLCKQNGRSAKVQNIVPTKIGTLVVYIAEPIVSGNITVNEQQRAAHVAKHNGRFHTFNDIILA